MELRTLKAFVEVVRQGGFSQAAKVLYATQSTVSKAVKQLEDELGVRLLERTVRGSRATEAGEIVFRRANSMMMEGDDLVSELDELRGLRKGSLRLGLPAIGSNALFAPLYAIYRKRYPGIEIQLVEYGSRRLEEMVLAGELDLGASLLPLRRELEWQRVRSEPIDVLIASSHPLARRKSVRLKELAGQDFILFGEGFAIDPIVMEACRKAGFTPTVAARSSQITFVLELVVAGLGVGFLPRLIAEQRSRPGLANIEVREPSMPWEMALMWRRNAYLSHAARAWLALAEEHYPQEARRKKGSARQA
jgi:DNA-binding transcriptional LysR family regulator